MVKIIKGEELLPTYAESILEVAIKACYADGTDNARAVAYDVETYERVDEPHYVICGVCAEDDNRLSYYPAVIIFTTDADIIDEVIGAERLASNDIAVIRESDDYCGSGSITWMSGLEESSDLAVTSTRVIENEFIMGDDVETVDHIDGVITMKLN